MLLTPRGSSTSPSLAIGHSIDPLNGYFPSGDKIDLLAVDTVRQQLVVIEAKSTEAKTQERDGKGRTAPEQAAQYVAQVSLHAAELFPFLQELADVLVRLYREGAPIHLDSKLPARWEVWWPEGRRLGPIAPLAALTAPTTAPKPTVAVPAAPPGGGGATAADLAGSTDDVVFVSSDEPWQRELRLRQSRWREARGFPIGDHNGRPLGSRLPMPAAEAELWNFLTPAIGALVRREYQENATRSRREQKMYGYPRLFNDLLSSQPLVFNLFGELTASEPSADFAAATIAARRLWPGRVDRVTRIEFEWSPGRWDARYLDNGTAADVALFHTTPDGGTGVIFVETKYHEDLRGKDYEVKHRYLEVALASGAFRPESLAALRSGSLQQIWFDHLLTLTTAKTDAHDSALFVVVYPEANTRCRDATALYRQHLDPSVTATFEVRTLEEILPALGEAIGDEWCRAFHARYLTPTNAR